MHLDEDRKRKDVDRRKEKAWFSVVSMSVNVGMSIGIGIGTGIKSTNQEIS